LKKKTRLEREGSIERKREGKGQVIKLGDKPIDIAVGPRPLLVSEVSLKLVSILIFLRLCSIVIFEYKVIFIVKHSKLPSFTRFANERNESAKENGDEKIII